MGNVAPGGSDGRRRPHGFFIPRWSSIKVTLSSSIFLALALLLSACKKEVDSAIDTEIYSPYVSLAKFNENNLNLDAAPSWTILKLSDGRYTISDSIHVEAIDPIGAGYILDCRFRFYQPRGKSAFVTGVIPRVTASGNAASYAAGFTFIASRSDVGLYLFEVYVTRTSGLESNHLIASLMLTRNNARPQLADLTIPDTLRRPNNGSRSVTFAVTANDSDGLADIEKVFFRSINSTSPNFEQPMFDDGNLHVTGDSVANDGRYSRLLTLDSSATLGIKEFRFWARDKAGALSDSLVHFIVVVPE